MKRIFLFILLMIIPVTVWAAWPSDSSRTKNWGSEILTDSDLEAQFDLLHTYNIDHLHPTTGHKHDGTANEGPLIDLDDNAGIIGIQGVLPIEYGGTEAVTFTDGGVLLGSSTGPLTAMSVLADGEIIVGDGTTDPVALGAFTSSTGTLKHESGGVEADISAVTTDSLIIGTGSGTMGLQDAPSWSKLFAIVAGGREDTQVVASSGTGTTQTVLTVSSVEFETATYMIFYAFDVTRSGGTSGNIKIKVDSTEHVDYSVGVSTYVGSNMKFISETAGTKDVTVVLEHAGSNSTTLDGFSFYITKVANSDINTQTESVIY